MRRKIWIGFTVAGLLVASMITQGALGLPVNGNLSAHDPIDPLAPKEEIVASADGGTSVDTWG